MAGRARERRFMGLLARISDILNKILLGIAGVLLLGTVFLTCANIFLRMVWVPIDGTFELVGFFGAVLTAFALGYTQLRQGHIAIDILTMQYPDRLQTVVSGTNGLLCGLFFSFCGWRVAVWAATISREGEVTETLRIIFHPFIYCVAFGCFVLAFVLFIDTLRMFRKKGS
jgi:TRAP-type C4-dicarboxylate transport system permease small subunit